MDFDINEVLADMLTTIKNNVDENWDQVKDTSNQFLQNKKERLELLAELRISGELSEEKFQSRLKDEKLVLEAELHAIAVISKAIAQRATNGAIEVLEKAIRTAISTIL